MSRKTVLVLGDSHTQALASAHKARAGREPKPDDVQFEIHWLAKRKREIRIGDLELAEADERATQLQSDDMMVISIAGTLHNVLGLLQHDKPFDLYTRGESTTPVEGRVVVPENALWDMFKGMTDPKKKILALRRKARCPVYHLATPPPKEDGEFIKARVARYRDRLVAEAGVNAPATRLKLWKLEMRVLAHVCAEASMHLVLPPVEAQTPEGFLKPEYYCNDATHANAGYGELVLRRLEALAAATPLAKETA
jgi:hypothetical protein